MSLTLTANGEELREQFFALHSREDVAKLLDIEESRLIYHLYVMPLAQRYAAFQIPKKSGGVRDITAPITALKIIQQKLNQVLQYVYQPKASVHGFVNGKSIVTNAGMHKRQKYVFNVDLKDFFPSINFGRVRGMFMAPPYNLEPVAATVLAQICCFNNQLPQGAPTSPIVSNMICAKMDSQLLRLAEKHRCIYTRYADDITFSTSMPQFSPALARISERTGQLEIGNELNRIIIENGFEINTKKVRLQTRNRRQEVTGLTANRFPNVERRYVRQIRAMLYAWKKFGLDAAEKEFVSKYDTKHRGPGKDAPSFKQIVKGKVEFLGMVRGKEDAVYLRFLEKLRALAPELVRSSVNNQNSNSTGIKSLIVTEGKTDWKHLRAALRKLQELGRFANLDIGFYEYEDEIKMGDAELLKMCTTYSRTEQSKPIIFIFDRDKPQIIRQVSGSDGVYKDWDNNVFSFAIPVPCHRKDAPDVSIELYYQDPEIKREDKKGRRLFLSNEFHQKSGRHRIANLNCTDDKARRSTLSVIDDQVFNENNENVALPKSDFADYVLTQADDFNDFDVSEFKKIFDIIVTILEDSRRP